MSNPEKKEQPASRSKLGSFFRRLLTLLTHNWGLKLGCFILAIILWGGLIMQDSSLLRPKIITDVTVNVQNEDSLLRNGYIVVSGLTQEKLSGLRMRVEVPQRVYNSVQASNYNARVDLSRIRSAGKQTLPILTTSSSTYGNVIDLSFSSIEVEVEEYTTRSRIPVRIATSGKLPEGLYGAAATADPIYVEIAGPKSLIDQVSRCVVPYDLSTLSYYLGTERTALPFRLEDRQENEIPQEHIAVSPLNSGIRIDTITVEQSLYEVVSIPVDVSSLISGEPMKGYHIESLEVDPSQIRIAFNDQIDPTAIDYIYASSPADISGLSETKAFNVSLVRPADAKYMGTTAVTLTVELAPDTPEEAATPAPEPAESTAPADAAADTSGENAT